MRLLAEVPLVRDLLRLALQKLALWEVLALPAFDALGDLLSDERVDVVLAVVAAAEVPRLIGWLRVTGLCLERLRADTSSDHTSEQAELRGGICCDSQAARARVIVGRHSRGRCDAASDAYCNAH